MKSTAEMSVKFAYQKNFKHVMIHEYVRYKFKKKECYAVSNRIFILSLLSHTQVGELHI
jgi:hypothetical protein